MATKTTTTYEVQVKVHGIDDAFVVSDSNAAYAVYMDFMAGKTIKIPADDGTTYVPFHAIEAVGVTTSSSSETIVDDFCVSEDESE